MANYPSSASNDANLYIGVNNKNTNLTAGIDAVVTTIPVVSTTGFPASGFVTIDLEIIAYTSIDATNFLGATRAADSSTATIHAINSLVSHNIVAAHHNVLKEEIKAVETDLVAVQASLVPLTPANTALSILERFRMIAQRFIDITGLANWYDVFVSFPTTKGGTGQTTYTDGQLLIGNTAGNTLTKNPLTGTANQITVTPGAGSITLSTPQNIAPASSPTFASETLTNTSNQLVLGTTNTTTVNAAAPAAPRVVTIPDLSGNFSVVGTVGAQTISGTKTFDGQLIGKGTITNDNATTGYIGEYIESTSVTNVNAAASNTNDDLVSISLTPGDWDVTGMEWWDSNGATWSAVICAITSVAGNDSAGQTVGVNRSQFNFASTSTAILIVSLCVPVFRVSISSTTTYYLKRLAIYSSGTPRTGGGRLSARRVR